MLLCWGQQVWALVDHALLVSVQEYHPSVEALAKPLEGPANDLRLMKQTLQSLGVASDQMLVLSDQVDQPHQPTRAGILAALDGLAARVRSGERVLIYLAGHGAQVPVVLDRTEADGLDEVFLPVDFRIESGTPKGMIRDDEIGLRIDQMISAGAHVWLVVDACHSGTLRRSAGSGAVARFVDLGVQGQSGERAEPFVEPVSRQGGGSFVGFYGAKAGYLSYEAKAAQTGQVHGLFTMALAKTLRARKGGSFRDLAREMTAELWKQAAGRSNPAFSGNLERMYQPRSDEVAAGIGIRFDKGFELAAGLLDGISEGAVLDVETQAGFLLFKLVVRHAELTKARAEFLSEDFAQLDAEIAKEGLDPARYRLRWLRDRAAQLTARLESAKRSFALPFTFDKNAMPRALGAQVQAVVNSLGPVLRMDSEAPILRLELEADRLVLGPVAEGAREQLSVANTPDGITALGPILRRVAKAWSVLEIANVFQNNAISSGLEVSLSVQKGEAKQSGGCADRFKTVKGAKYAAVVQIGHCDRVTIELSNASPQAMDITPLYIGADRRIYFLPGFKGSARGGLRLLPGRSGNVRYTEVLHHPRAGALAVGPMHLLMLVVESDITQPPTDFRFLEQEQMPAQVRSSPRHALITEMMNSVGFGLTRFRTISKSDKETIGAVVIPVETFFK